MTDRDRVDYEGLSGWPKLDRNAEIGAMNEQIPISVDEVDPSDNPAVCWVPRWIVECDKECEVGITVDDHCFVVLAKTWAGQWMPTNHIPREAAKRIGELSRDYL